MAARPSRPTVRTMNAPKTPNWPGRIALAASVALIVGYALLAPRTPTRTCAAGRVSVAVAASQEKSALLRELAQAYERGDARVGERCVSVQILEKASGDAEQALARGWEETSDGPRPDVWSPASTAWTVLLREHRSARDAAGGLVPHASPSLLQSPLVLAMPVPMAEALGWPNAEIGWSDVLALARDPRGWAARGHPERGRFRLGNTRKRRRVRAAQTRKRLTLRSKSRITPNSTNLCSARPRCIHLNATPQPASSRTSRGPSRRRPSAPPVSATRTAGADRSSPWRTG